MRTTLDIDEDVLFAVKEIADALSVTAGKAMSDLARKGLAAPKRPAKVRNGVPLLAQRPAGSLKPTMRLVNELRDEA